MRYDPKDNHWYAIDPDGNKVEITEALYNVIKQYLRRRHGHKCRSARVILQYTNGQMVWIWLTTRISTGLVAPFMSRADHIREDKTFLDEISDFATPKGVLDNPITTLNDGTPNDAVDG